MTAGPTASWTTGFHPFDQHMPFIIHITRHQPVSRKLISRNWEFPSWHVWPLHTHVCNVRRDTGLGRGLGHGIEKGCTGRQWLETIYLCLSSRVIIHGYEMLWKFVCFDRLSFRQTNAVLIYMCVVYNQENGKVMRAADIKHRSIHGWP